MSVRDRINKLFGRNRTGETTTTEPYEYTKVLSAHQIDGLPQVLTRELPSDRATLYASFPELQQFQFLYNQLVKLSGDRSREQGQDAAELVEQITARVHDVLNPAAVERTLSGVFKDNPTAYQAERVRFFENECATYARFVSTRQAPAQ